jgi:hypothetical protein
MIVLTPEQRDLLLDYREKFKDILIKRMIDIDPIEIKNGNYILPEKILQDPLYQDLIPKVDLGKVEIREVTEDELITE